MSRKNQLRHETNLIRFGTMVDACEALGPRYKPARANLKSLPMCCVAIRW